MMHGSFLTLPCKKAAHCSSQKPRSQRKILSLETLEERLAPAIIQAVSLADPSLYAVSATGFVNTNIRGTPLSNDGQFLAFEGDYNLLPNENNNTSDVFLRNLSTGTTSLISVTPSGVDGNAASQNPVITANGRYVAFESYATNLVSGLTVSGENVYVRDTQMNTTTLVSVNSAGTGSGNGDSADPVISADGRYVAFDGFATNLVNGLPISGNNVYVRDLVAGTTTLVSVNQAGTGSGNNGSASPVLTPDGRYVAFQSFASNLVAGDTNNTQDVFVRDLQTGTTSLVSVNSAGTASGNSLSETPLISADGRYLAFDSLATNLVNGVTVSHNNVYLRDRTGGTTTLLSVSSAGSGAGNNDSYLWSISADGLHVACVTCQMFAKGLPRLGSGPASLSGADDAGKDARFG